MSKIQNVIADAKRIYRTSGINAALAYCFDNGISRSVDIDRLTQILKSN